MLRKLSLRRSLHLGLWAIKGQGVVEYAGALVIAVGLIAVAVGSLPDFGYQFLQTIQNSILNFFLDSLDNLGN